MSLWTGQPKLPPELQPAVQRTCCIACCRKKVKPEVWQLELAGSFIRRMVRRYHCVAASAAVLALAQYVGSTDGPPLCRALLWYGKLSY